MKILPALSRFLLLLLPLYSSAIDSATPAPFTPKPAAIVRNLEYANVSSQSLLLDLYIPASTNSLLPLVVWIHGGGWEGGNKDNPPVLFLVKSGYAVASINYRFSQIAKFPAQLHDCKAAIRFLRAKALDYNLDPDHIGVIGASAGGHLSALLGLTANEKDLEGSVGSTNQSSRVQAVCDWFGPTDLTLMVPDARLKEHRSDSPSTVVAKLIGGPVAQNRDKAARASPITYATPDRKDIPPFLIMHGDKDPLVPLSQSELLTAAIKKAGGDVTLHVEQGAAHGFGGEKVFRMITMFFDKHLKTKTNP